MAQSFSLLQSRKFRLPVPKGDDDANANDHKRGALSQLAKLCPSMDLVLVRSTSKLGSLAIYRSLSWQKVADIILPESLSDAADGVGGTSRSSVSNTPLSCCWSPNGQCVAVAMESNIFLYGVESLVAASGASSAGGSSSGSSNATWTIDLAAELKQPSSADDVHVDVSALHWVHVGKLHPTAALPSSVEEEQEISWR